jgi:two-component system sensor histidine kinase VanS
VSARLRLTLSYAGFLLVAGVALMALVFYILRFVPEGNLNAGGPFMPDRSDLLDALWPRTWQLLLVLAAIGLGGGWFLAGRMLRPLQQINAVARRVAAGSLDQRVQLGGRHDEFRELADTFDSMLDRLQGSFNEQRRFAANAAHELRTPYAIERSMLDVALADPAAQDVRQLLTRLDHTNRRGIEVVEALLSLATIDAGHTIDHSPLDVAETVADVIRELRPLADEAGVTITSVLGEGDIDASATLVRQLAANLVLNGIRHNVSDGGWVRVRTETMADAGVQLVVSNSGPIVSDELLGTMTEPFVRGAGRVGTRTPGSGAGVGGMGVVGGGAMGRGAMGSGLGLALVARVADVHGAALGIVARPAGGLDVTVRFPGPGTAGGAPPV